MVNKDFLKQVLADKKRLMPLKEVKWVVVAKFDELSVANLQEKMKVDAEFMQYFPDSLPKGKLHDRSFFFNILMTVKPEYVQAMVEHANKQRFGCIQPDTIADTIEVTNEWWNALNAMPFFS